MMPNTSMELPYDGVKEMILVDNVEDSDFLCQLIKAIYEELPTLRKNDTTAENNRFRHGDADMAGW